MRAGSFLVTVFGDAIVPRGGDVWLGSLIRLVEPFGISDRLVRTSVHRLAADGVLAGRQVGRRSYYRLTPREARLYARASRRIYAPPADQWDGRWTLVFLNAAPARDTLRRELGWLGFGRVDAGVMAHPAADAALLEETLSDLGAAGDVVTMTARLSDRSAHPALAAFAASAWDLDDVAARYATFTATFRQLLVAAGRARALDGGDCLAVRLLMIHEYRKALLRDPRLPADLLPPRWAGDDAYATCRDLYALMLRPSEAYLSLRLETDKGSLPPADAVLANRFRAP